MPLPEIEVDYLIVGAGAAGMAFADSLMSETQATLALVDKHHRPGGHWNDAYPFVRLHQPAAYYGVNSRPLGSGAKDLVGLNAGLYELASGHEVLTHFDQVMQQSFLPSGRVHYFPMSQAEDDRRITSLLSGEQRMIAARKFVDATYSQTKVPSTHRPQYAVHPDITCVPLNDLPQVATGYAGYVVVGAGKTGMDACLWLLENGVDPATIRWVMARDSWLLDRVHFQPGPEFLAGWAKNLGDQVEALALADSVDDVFVRLESSGSIRRIDESVKPEAYHCATVSDSELAELRRIRNIVRLGRVIRIDPDRIVLNHGAIPTSRECLHVDCSAIGIPTRPPTPVFEGDRIILQMVRLCQPAFSAALIGHVEATLEDESEKNQLCRPIPPPTTPLDWVRVMGTELANRRSWSENAGISEWIASSRLDGFTNRVRSLTDAESEVIHQLGRYREFVGPAVKNLERLLGGNNEPAAARTPS